jgi:hypothetical protein
MKAQQAYRDANSGLPSKIPNDIFKPSNPEEETKNELSIFSGKTHTLTAKSTSSAVASTANTPSSSSNKSRSSSDSPQLAMPDNPSFKNVHPSLASELNVFNGLIKRQLENAYKSGGEVFGGGEPMVVDGQGSGGGGVHHHQPTQMHQQQQQLQQQQQQPQQVMYQPDYQRQHFDEQEAKRLEREREEAANREMERQEMENHDVKRQELARQQQLQQQREIQRQQAHGQEIQRQQQHELLRQQHQQQAQHEIIQQQQQLDIQRQQEKQQQQMQDRYRQQLEVQQHQLQQRQPAQYHLQRHSYDHDQPPMLTEPDHGMVTSSAHTAAPPMLTLSHSQSQPNIRHAYQQRSHHYQPIHHPDTADLSSYAPHAPVQHVTQRAQQPMRYSTVAQQSQPQQHSMYAVPPEYSSWDSIQSGISYIPPPPTSTYLPLTPISATSSPSTYVPHWSASSYSFSMPDQQATSASTAGSAGYPWATTIPRKQTPEYQQHQQYTPEGALRGIAADDHSLQETWQSYMNKVPPNFLRAIKLVLDDDDANSPFFIRSVLRDSSLMIDIGLFSF